MKKIIVSVIVFLVYLPQSSAIAADKFFEIEEIEIDSSVLNEKRKIIVFLPENYEASNKRYPVLYLTDGDIHGPHTKGTLDYLAKFDQTPDMIVVGIVTPRQSRNQDLTVLAEDKQLSGYPKGADRFLAYIEKEIIPLVNERFRTLKYSAISGTSHGGQFAINALLKRPQLFNGIIAISPSLYWNKNQLLTASEGALKDQRLYGRLFVSIANEEPIMTSAFKNFVELTKRYPSKNLSISTNIFSQESHNTTVLLGQYYGLKHLFAEWAIPEEPQTLSDLQAIFDARSKLLDMHIEIPEDRANGYGQWLQYLDREEDALELFRWNRDTYPQSFSAHQALIKAYLHFNRTVEAKAALHDALKTIDTLNFEQKKELKSLTSSLS